MTLPKWLERLNPFNNAQRAATTLLLVGLGVAFAGYLLKYISPNTFNFLDNITNDFYANIAAELVSIGITVGIIDKANRRESENERKEELILQMGSPNKALAVEAIRLLRLKGWWKDGSLKGSNLLEINLERFDLSDVNLEGANLLFANLRRAQLFQADLRNTDLRKANLTGAILVDTVLEGADLREAILDKVEWQAGTNNPQLVAILPDGSKWTPDRDMREFTHPDEWQAEQSTKQGNHPYSFSEPPKYLQDDILQNDISEE